MSKSTLNRELGDLSGYYRRKVFSKVIYLSHLKNSIYGEAFSNKKLRNQKSNTERMRSFDICTVMTTNVEQVFCAPNS